MGWTLGRAVRRRWTKAGLVAWIRHRQQVLDRVRIPACEVAAYRAALDDVLLEIGEPPTARPTRALVRPED